MPLSQLYVADLHQGTGHRHCTSKSAIAYAGDKTEIVLVMNSANRPLRRFYKKFGFIPAPLISLRKGAA